MKFSLAQRCFLEALGTALLAYTIGRVGSADLNPFEQSIGIGLCLALLIHVIGRFSGAHFNPAVTLLLNHQRFGNRAFKTAEGLIETVGYIAAQIVGALIGLALNPASAGAGDFALDGLVPEVLFSLALYSLILRWSDEGRICPFAQPLSGIVIGFGLAFLALIGGLSQSGIYNPAIAIGLASNGMSGVMTAIAGQLIAVVVLLVMTRSSSAAAQ